MLLPGSTAVRRRTSPRGAASAGHDSPRILVVLLALVFATTPAAAQIVLDSTEELSWSRPEAWALKYFTAVSMMSGFSASSDLERGDVALALDVGWVPTLSEEERRVGFLGSKVEDLNRTSVFGRGRLTLGLPSDWSLEIGYVPPVEIDGVTPEIFNLALSRAVVSRPGWILSARLSLQTGGLSGDLTCPSDVVGSTDPSVNPDNCLRPSEDEVTMDYAGIELTYTRTAGNRWRPYLAASANLCDLELKVDARYSVFIDRMRQTARGWTYTLAAGTRYRTSAGFDLAGEIFYAPLSVVRDPVRGSQNDSLLNARVLIEYRIR
jgi:hypothetical protein